MCEKEPERPVVREYRVEPEWEQVLLSQPIGVGVAEGGRGFVERCTLYTSRSQAALLYVNHQSPPRARLVCQRFIYVYLLVLGVESRALCTLSTRSAAQPRSLSSLARGFSARCLNLGSGLTPQLFASGTVCLLSGGDSAAEA